MAMSLLTSVSGFMASLDSSDRDSTPSSKHQQDAAVDRIWVVLGALDSWSETHAQFAAAMRDTLMAHAAYFNALVLGTSAGRSRQDDMAHIVSKHRDILGVEARRHFSKAMLPELDADLSPLDMERPLEVLIYRSRLLSESFWYIYSATRDELHAGLDVEFVNEEAIGDGVTREWVTLVCRALFDPQQGLFSPCPHNRRRFFLNPGKLICFPSLLHTSKIVVDQMPFFMTHVSILFSGSSCVWSGSTALQVLRICRTDDRISPGTQNTGGGSV
jgi:E3 ubiquitin-protein ligase NEDD4